MNEFQTKELQKTLEAELIKSAQEAKRIGYNPTAFFRMLNEHGGYGAAKKLINNSKITDGLVKLFEKGRLDLTVEAVILKQKYTALFTKEERVIAKERLERYGYDTNKILQSINESNALEQLEFKEEKFRTELSSKNYIVGEDTRYYVLTVKVSPYDKETNGKYKYSIFILDNHKVVREDKVESDSRNILTVSKQKGIEQLLKLNRKVLLDEITMVHYKQDRNNGDPWQKDSKEVLEELYNKYKVEIVMESLLSQSEEAGNDRKKLEFEKWLKVNLNVSEYTRGRYVKAPDAIDSWLIEESLG